VEVEVLQITTVEFFSPCQLLACPIVRVRVHVETSNQDLVKLAVVIGGGKGDRTYTRNLSGSTSYDVTIPGSGETGYPQVDACSGRLGLVFVTASTTPSTPEPASQILQCP
jgi:hypothetical protein